jgi:hypothetical protein
VSSLDFIDVGVCVCVCVCVYFTSVRKHVNKSRVLEGPRGAKDAGGGRPPGFYLVKLVT